MALFLKGGPPSPSFKRVEAERLAVGRVHLVGVGGTGLRGMAGILSARGLEVSGSEAVTSPVVEFLRKRGVSCKIGHRRDNLSPETQLVLISAAIRQDNPEVQAARHRGIPILKYAEVLGLLMQERSGIAIAGTHGKTTTTAMTAQVLLEAREEPSFIIGGDCPAIGGSSRWGNGEYFVAEACEFDRSFLNLHPRYAVVTNIEEEHIDYFRSLRDVQNAFSEFASHLPESGFLVLNADDPHSRLLIEHSACPIGRFSLQRGAGDWWAERIKPKGRGVRFVATSREGERRPILLRTPGIHNVKNALAVIVLLRHIGIPLENIATSLEGFTGVKRRFEILIHKPCVVIDDYAHHPTEVQVVIKAARESFAGQRLRVIFQPHQYSRTYRFLGDFARALKSADDVVVTDVFAARDSKEDMRRISSPALVEAIHDRRGDAVYVRGFDNVIGHVSRTFQPDDVYLCLGAGDITYLAAQLGESLQKAPSLAWRL